VFDEHRYFEPGLASNSLLSITSVSVICEDWWNDEEFWGKRSYAINPIADLAELCRFDGKSVGFALQRRQAAPAGSDAAALCYPLPATSPLCQSVGRMMT